MKDFVADSIEEFDAVLIGTVEVVAVRLWAVVMRRFEGTNEVVYATEPVDY